MIKKNDIMTKEEALVLKKEQELKLAKKKANESKRTHENHQKYMIGGAMKKYFPDALLFEEKDWNRIIPVVVATKEFKAIIAEIEAENEEEEVPDTAHEKELEERAIPEDFSDEKE